MPVEMSPDATAASMRALTGARGTGGGASEAAQTHDEHGNPLPPIEGLRAWLVVVGVFLVHYTVLG